MVQFKPYYTGEAPAPYRRATTAQRCFRTSDLDEVGKTSRHLTFFEMLGNFSFGDYFKREAIAWGWEYSTQVLRLNADLIWVSVYEEDHDAYAIWEKEIGLPARKIIRLGANDNFWGPAGDTGPCGPCSELHIDRGPAMGCGRPDCAPGCEHCERFLEFWNLVFPQYDQQPDGSRLPLRNRGIDTGMGLERVAALLQNKETVFDTDGIYPVIEATQALCKVRWADNPAPFRVIADHARALAFMVADGILPGNERRGYVVRRLLRRTAYCGRKLGFEKPFLHEVTKTVVDLMGHQYPELVEKRLQIEKVILTEEERFAGTLARGMDLLEEMFERMTKAGDTGVPGAELFRLHDTYGFPLDLATDIARDRGYTVDREGFEAAMTKQREQARSAWAGSGEEAISPVYRVILDEVGPTQFVGYDAAECTAKIVALVRSGKRVDQLDENDEGEIILDQTPFYAESGGQIGDTGAVDAATGNAHVSETKTPLGKMTLHVARVIRGMLSVGDSVLAQVNAKSRRATENHHTATHLLQAALRDILGDHVHQAGSLVTPERLRFDFTHFEAIGAERLQDIEREVNAFIRADAPVSITFMPIAEARKAGAMALFGEKYEDVVRVVRVGDISIELCGGCHVKRTGVIGYCKILNESSVAAGVRRIEAVCGDPCVDMLQARDRQLARSAALLNAGVDDLEARVQALLDENRRLAREVARWKQAAVTGASVDYLARAREVRGIKVLAAQVEDQDPAGLRMLLDNLRDKLGSGVIVLGSAAEGKVSLCVGVTKDLIGRIKAGDIVRRIAPIVGGGGGGKPEMAQAGGKCPEKLPEAIDKTPEIVGGLLG
jgi:alanyl-tRNA synthetase